MRNPKVQSVFLEDMPIHRAAFASGGNQVTYNTYQCPAIRNLLTVQLFPEVYKCGCNRSAAWRCI